MGNQLDIFGESLVQITHEPRADSKPHRKPTRPQGYADRPGTGPEGETCKTCTSRVRITYSKAYHKCAMFRQLGGRWTNGPGTDILVNSPACSKWEQREGDVKEYYGG